MEVLNAIAANKESVIKACQEAMYQGSIDYEMTEFLATLTPAQPEIITVTATASNPLNNQLKALTGDGWNWSDWDGDLMDSNIIKHIRTGLVVQVL